MANAKYCLPTDIVTGVPTSGQAVDAAYPLTNLYDRNPAKPAKFTSTGNTRIIWNFGAAQRLDAIFIPQHNFSTSLAVKFQGNATDSWGSPTVDAALTISADHEDGHCCSPWKDLTTVAGYTQAGFQYWSLYLPSFSVAPQIGEVILVQQLRSFTHNIEWNLKWGERRNTFLNVETEFLVQHYYDLNTPIRVVLGQFTSTDADLTSLLALHRASHGGYYPFVFVLDPAVETDNGLYVRFSKRLLEYLELTYQFLDCNIMPLEFEEVSRGLPL